MLKVDILTIFPDFFREVFDFGIVRRARKAAILDVTAHDLRSWATDKHKMVDDRPFGGGDGMVLKPEPIFAAVEKLVGTCERANYPSGTKVILLTPQGKVFKQSIAQEIVENSAHLILICGRYEGVDERVNEALVTNEISIGDYVLSGGEPAALVVVDALTRLLPGALGSETSAVNDSFSANLLDFPHFTRPPEFQGKRVPEVLLNGNHAEIEKWRRQKALEKTAEMRPDLLTNILENENE